MACKHGSTSIVCPFCDAETIERERTPWTNARVFYAIRLNRDGESTRQEVAVVSAAEAKALEREMSEYRARAESAEIAQVEHSRRGCASESEIEPRPIKSAPKDEHGVLAYSPTFYQGKGGWVAAVWNEHGWHSNPGGWRFEPTHWLPMPGKP